MFDVILLTLVLFMVISIVWGTLRVGISPMPSSKRARDGILQLMDKTAQGPIYDLGSGWGNLLIPLAKKYPDRTIVGYELSLLPWLTTYVLIRIMGLSNIELYRKNFLQADLSQAVVLVCYLYPNGMRKLEDKLKAEQGQLKYLISHHFALPSYQAMQTIQLQDVYRSPIYLYKMP